MAAVAHLRKLGLFVQDDFLEAAMCDQLVAELRDAPGAPGAIWNPDRGEFVEPSVKRRTELAGVAPALEAAVRTRLSGLGPCLADHFGRELIEVQPIKFARYDAGDFFAQHVDMANHPDAPAHIRRRKLSVVVFLNDESGEPREGEHAGGHLTFYDLLPDPLWRHVGHPLPAGRGRLVAFRPETLHEVGPVETGSRWTLSTWFC